jgi:hypothetical protein
MELFTPTWKSKNAKRALKAVGKMTDQRKLAKVAKEAPYWGARKAAVEKLTDQALLADIAKNDKDSGVRIAAVKKLTDQDALVYIAKNDKDFLVRIAAVEKLTGQALLAYIAKNDEVSYVREAAVKKLTDQALLAYIAKNDEDWHVRKAAVEKLTDQALLADVAKNDKDSDVRIAAIENLLSRECFREALDGIYSFINYNTETKIHLATMLVNAAQKSGPPLKMQWNNIKTWVDQVPGIPHRDWPHEDCPSYVDYASGYGFTGPDDHIDSSHEDISATYAPKFPPYPFEQ